MLTSNPRRRHPVTLIVSVVLILLGIVSGALLVVCRVISWWWVIGLLAVYAVIAFSVIVLVRVVEDHENDSNVWKRIYGSVFRLFNRVVAWWRLPAYFGSFNLIAIRNDLRENNLHDTSPPAQPDLNFEPVYRVTRTADGTFNDLEKPHMGAANTRFGRNTRPDKVRLEDDAEILQPNPRAISLKLLTRDTFRPATTLNLLAAAWIQFQNHDWFNHRRNNDSQIQVPLQTGDAWHENPMRITRTEHDSTVLAGQTARFVNTETHWWDASTIYGSSQEIQAKVRSFQDGKLIVDKDGRLPLVSDAETPHLTGIEQTGFNDNWWVGLSLLHTLFTWEHNSVCEALKREYPSFDDEKLFQTARLIVAGLIARIHTVEWTPGILAHPTLQVGMNGNWWGLLGEAFRKVFGRVSDSDAISGIMGSPTHHHTAPYSLTEEFVSVYRLHPLIPDEYSWRRVSDNSLIGNSNFNEIQGNSTRPFMDRDDMTVANLFYSFGVMHPGAITLHNFPKALQSFERIAKDGNPAETLDLGTIDILRDRERGVPRYNDFREMLRKPRVKSFRQLTSDPEWAKQMEDVYEGEIDKVDTMIGMFAEPLPPGFGFSDTAFRIFVLMASRRLKSDRFFTVDFTPQVYTPLGIDWINSNTMGSVLMRHVPELAPALMRSQNAFAPWSRTM